MNSYIRSYDLGTCSGSFGEVWGYVGDISGIFQAGCLGAFWNMFGRN